MSEKNQQPTAKRLREAREKGDVPKSAETISSAFFVGVCVALAVGVGTLFGGCRRCSGSCSTRRARPIRPRGSRR